MTRAGSTVLRDGSRLRTAGLWAAPLIVVFGVWLWLVFSSGGYLPRQWMPATLALGLFGLVVALLAAYPRRPRQLSLAVLFLFGLYAVWVAASVLWAASTTRVWMETGRTFGYLLIFSLALIYLTNPAARKIFRYLLMAASCVLLAVCVVRLWSTQNLAGLFIENRFSYPVSYPNNAAALFLIPFWPLMWLAAGPEERAPVRGIALGLATGLLGFAIMTQSRGAIWSLAITLVIMFIVSPARIRTLLYLVVPAVLLVYEFPNLNRYWLKGPEAVGGGLGARTILVASIIAAFIGMIVALLERWIVVTRRMKAIFGSVILLGAAAAVIYGSITLTSDVGGPFKWISQTWREFTGQTTTSESATATRFTYLSSSGRVGIWRVALTEFENAPVLGVGADNFVFEYDRLRKTETYKPQQAHSIELQILGETGVIGAVFAFGGMLLALGGILWPRSSAGWRGARETWLRRRKSRAAKDPPTTRPPSNPPGVDPSSAKPSTTAVVHQIRWGNNSLVYGWEMAIFAAVAYWLIHASVDWLWQMAGVSIPALLLLAAGIASVDARAVTLWPRWHRWLSLTPQAVESQDGVSEHAESEAAGVNLPVAEGEGPDDAEGESRATDEPPTVVSGVEPTPERDELLPVERRSDRYLSKRARRARRERRKRRASQFLQPPGVLSPVFRALLVALSLLVIILVGLPYLSLKYQDSAWGIAKSDGVRAAARAEAAHWFQPSDPGPYVTQAGIYSSAASTAAEAGAPERAGAVLDDLALSIGSYQNAVDHEPADWSLRYRAGVATLNLMLATEYATGSNPGLDYPALIPVAPGLQDWSALSGSSSALPQPGLAATSLAATPATRETAARYRGMSKSELQRLALGFLATAKERNPLASEVSEAIKIAGG